MKARILSAAPGSGAVWFLVVLSLGGLILLANWPKVREMQMEAKESTAKQCIKAFREAALAFYSDQKRFPVDGTEGVRHPEGGFAKGPDGRELSPGQTTLGDLLMAGGYLEQVYFPSRHKPEPGGWIRGQERWPEIRAMRTEDLANKLVSRPPFASAESATVVVLLTLPGLTQEEAAFWKRKLDRFVSADAATRSDTQLLKMGLAGAPLAMGDLRFVADSNETGIYTGFLYLAHE